MADFLHAQDVFSKGELSPTMYARISLQAYYKGLKTAKNVLPIPQGGARKRFGTIYDATLPVNDYTQIYPIAFEYLDECIYQVIFYANNIAIYLEGGLVATVATAIDGPDTQLIDETVLEAVLSITVGFQAPYYLSRAAGSPNTITAASFINNTISLTTAVSVGLVLPVSFTIGGTFTTNPQIKVGRTYFINPTSVNTTSIYLTATDAASQINPITISAFAGSNTMIPQNNWTFAPIPFRNVPTYDFTGGYDAITFTPGATSGSTTLTASAPIYTAAMVGGLYVGGGGTARITAFTDSTHITVQVIDDFTSTAAIPGSLSLLTEPAWSDLRGWPKVNGSYQNRAIFANTDSLPNGFWASVSNDYNDFDDSSLDADMAISWYPTSDVGSTILYITPYRSLIVHTDAGVYSTPMNFDVAITPSNFSLALQDSTPPGSIQPIAIDNQLMVVSGRDVNSLLWEFGQAAYVPNLISAISEHLITDPFWIMGFRDRTTEGGRYLFVSNRDTGQLAMYQTLLSEEIAGWTPAVCEQSLGNAFIRQTIASVLGRCWLLVQRDMAVAQTPIVISGFAAPNILTAIGSNFSTTVPTAVLFATSSALPTTVPQINTGTYYYAVGVNANTFIIYASQSDALAGINSITIQSAGVMSTVIPYTLTQILNLEELSYNVNTDCAMRFSGTNLAQASGLNLFNGQFVTVKGDGRVWDSNPVINGVETISLLGVPQTVSTLEIGFPIKYKVVPLPISIPMNGDIQSGNLTYAKHIRTVNVMFTNTIGGKINNQNVALKNLEVAPFTAPIPQNGVMEVSLMEGWNLFKAPQLVVSQEDPYDFNLIGLFYRIEV